jgi:arylsulfatase A-like enzyme
MKPKLLKSVLSGLVALIFLLTAVPPALAQDGSSLPFPPTPSGSVAKRTIKASTYSPLKPEKHLPADAPNVLIMMLDDSGPSLPDTFGGDIHTPTVSRLAKTGITYNRFHNTAMCSPTRASLLTGRNHHRVGFGQIAELANDWDGYSGSWPATAASVGEVLRDYGYSTSAFGKWHNTPADETTAMGPFDRWPSNLGFEYFYGFLAGESSQYEPAIVENTNRIETPKKEKYHFTEDMTDHAVEWINQHQALAPDKPFLMYWAPGAVHGPHHIFKEWADQYKGKFDEGWDVMRERIFDQQKSWAGFRPIPN